MIKLHRKISHQASDDLEQKLIDLVLAYEKVEYPSNVQGELFPFIEENGNTYKTDAEIAEWLTVLEKELTWQRSISGDSCFIDPKTGRVC